MGLTYRAGQFFRNLLARPQVEDLNEARAYLSPELFVLFTRMHPADQAHSLRVFRALQAAGEQDQDLLAAGLLHDVGKAQARPALWQRVVAVLAGPFLRGRLERMATLTPRGWQAAFVIAAAHPQWGADMVSQAGGSKQLVHLIRHHQSQALNGLPPTEVYLVRRLQQIDNRH